MDFARRARAGRAVGRRRAALSSANRQIRRHNRWATLPAILAGQSGGAHVGLQPLASGKSHSRIRALRHRGAAGLVFDGERSPSFRSRSRARLYRSRSRLQQSPRRRRPKPEFVVSASAAQTAPRSILNSAPLNSSNYVPCVTANGTQWQSERAAPSPNGKRKGFSRSDRSIKALAGYIEAQGLPAGFLDRAPFTVEGKVRVVGNGVPLPMGRAV